MYTEREHIAPRCRNGSFVQCLSQPETLVDASAEGERSALGMDEVED